MSLIDVLPDVESLSRVEKIRLLQLLAQDLETDEISLIGMDAILAVRQRSDFPISMAIESPVQTRGSVDDRDGHTS